MLSNTEKSNKYMKYFYENILANRKQQLIVIFLIYNIQQTLNLLMEIANDVHINTKHLIVKTKMDIFLHILAKLMNIS